MRYLTLLVVSCLSLRLHAQCGTCTVDIANSPNPYGFNPDTLDLPAGIDTSLTIQFTFPDSIRQGAFTLYPNYAIWVDSLRLLNGRITRRGGNAPFAYDPQNPENGAIVFNIPHVNKIDQGTNCQANFVIYRNPGTSAGPAGGTPPRGCASVCLRTSATPGCDMLLVRVRVFVPQLSDADNKDTTNLAPIILGNPAWLDTIFRYPVRIGGATCTSADYPTVTTPRAQCQPSSLLSNNGVATLSIFPNPAIQNAEIRFTLSQSSSLTLRAIAADGREVYRHTGTYSAGEHTHTLRLPAGVYVVSVGSGDSWISQRLVVVE